MRPGGGIVANPFLLIGLAGVVEVFQAGGLGLLDQLEGALRLAGKALFIDGERAGALVDVVLEGGRSGAGGGGSVFCGADFVLVLDGGQGETGLFHGGDSIEAPRGVGDGLDELALHGAGGFVMDKGFSAEYFVGLEVVGWDDDGVAGEAMSVEARALFAFRGAGSGGFMVDAFLGN